MTNTTTSNQELAQYYFRAKTPYSGGRAAIEGYRRIMNLIAGVDVNIAAFYAKHGSLRDLKIPRIGDDTKRVLETILEKGVDEAIKATVDVRTAELQARPVSRYYKPVPKFYDDEEHEEPSPAEQQEIARKYLQNRLIK